MGLDCLALGLSWWPCHQLQGRQVEDFFLFGPKEEVSEDYVKVGEMETRVRNIPLLDLADLLYFRYHLRLKPKCAKWGKVLPRQKLASASMAAGK